MCRYWKFIYIVSNSTSVDRKLSFKSDDKNNDTTVTKAKHKLINVVIHWLNKNRAKLCSKLKMNDLCLEEINWAN